MDLICLNILIYPFFLHDRKILTFLYLDTLIYLFKNIEMSVSDACNILMFNQVGRYGGGGC